MYITWACTSVYGTANECHDLGSGNISTGKLNKHILILRIQER